MKKNLFVKVMAVVMMGIVALGGMPVYGAEVGTVNEAEEAVGSYTFSLADRNTGEVYDLKDEDGYYYFESDMDNTPTIEDAGNGFYWQHNNNGTCDVVATVCDTEGNPIPEENLDRGKFSIEVEREEYAYGVSGYMKTEGDMSSVVVVNENMVDDTGKVWVGIRPNLCYQPGDVWLTIKYDDSELKIHYHVTNKNKLYCSSIVDKNEFVVEEGEVVNITGLKHFPEDYTSLNGKCRPYAMNWKVFNGQDSYNLGGTYYPCGKEALADYLWQIHGLLEDTHGVLDVLSYDDTSINIKFNVAGAYIVSYGLCYVNVTVLPKGSTPVAPVDPTEPTDPTPTEGTYFLGDVNVDNKVEANDALEILKDVVGLGTSEVYSQKGYKLADVDGSGDVSATDALEVLRMVVGLTEKVTVQLEF